MNKKIISFLVLFLVIIFAAVSCASIPEVALEERFDTIMLGSAEVEYADAVTSAYYEMILSMPELEEPLEMTFSSVIHSLFDYSNKDNLKMYMDMSTDIMGQDMNMEMYYDNSNQYIDSMGMKIKVPTPVEEVLTISTIKPLIMVSEDMESLTMEYIDSVYIFTFAVSEQGLESYYDEFSSLIDEMNLDMTGDVGIAINSFQGTLRADENNKMLGMSFEASMSLDIESLAVPVYISSDTVYNSFNEPVEISFPNLDEYIEMNQ